MALRLMCVTAHPDDESAGFGGALLMAHGRGADTTVICLTEGRAASNRGDTRSDDELAAARLAELDVSCGILGVTRYEVWKYPDGALIQADLFQMVTRLVARLRMLRPHIVLTFGGDGGANLHRDHAVASFAATAAFHWSGRSNFAKEQLEAGLKLWAPQKLYYSSTHFTVSKFKEEAAVAPRTPASVKLDLGLLQEVKRQAIEAHDTQGVMSRAAEAYERYGHEEHYLLASARNPERFEGETDIFAGIEEA
ncbi:MAG TPA: PIG-L family deacetylase [Acidobacteriaceae bacterium]